MVRTCDAGAGCAAARHSRHRPVSGHPRLPRQVAGVLLLIGLVAGAPAAAQQDTVQRDARAWEQALESAVITRASDRLARLVADGFVLRGEPDIDRGQWLATTAALCWGDRFGLEDFKATGFGNTVTASFALTFYVNPETCRPAVVRTLVTDVWLLHDGVWQLYLRHSAPAPDAARGLAAHYGLVPQPLPAWNISAELSMAATSGNTSVQTLGTGGTLVHRQSRATTRLTTSFLSSRSAGVLNARALTVQGRHATRQGEHVEWFGQVGYTRDAFAGVEHRATPDGGVALTVERPNRYAAAVEAAIGYTVESRIESPDLQFVAARLALRGSWTGIRGAELRQEIEMARDLSDVGNWRGASVTAFTLTVTRFASMSLSQSVDYRHAPVPGFRALDLRSAAAIVLSFQRR